MTVNSSANSVILIVFAFSDNLSAENSKLSSDSANRGNHLFGCMGYLCVKLSEIVQKICEKIIMLKYAVQGKGKSHTITGSQSTLAQTRYIYLPCQDQTTSYGNYLLRTALHWS